MSVVDFLTMDHPFSLGFSSDENNNESLWLWSEVLLWMFLGDEEVTATCSLPVQLHGLSHLKLPLSRHYR